MNIFGHEDFVDIFGVITNWAILGGHLYTF